MIVATGLTDIGCKRSQNEDRILVELDSGIFAVADGMGGHQCGARAAELATSALQEYFRSHASESPHQAMTMAIQFANETVLRESVAAPECSGMGCTVSAVTIENALAIVGNVGDSRVYLYRRGELLQLTRDDSVLAKLLQSGAITPEDAPTHPLRNMLTQSVGTNEAVDIQISELTLAAGDRLLLSTDGLHGVITDSAIAEILVVETDPAEAARKLIAAACECGGPDNVSCIVINYL